ncbi:hypothetical protein FACS1894125_3440 [Actinomycetota bacterium]|nr:hypothetical protein FACS1894125_3440 [Actinomycetota bacterium]
MKMCKVSVCMLTYNHLPFIRDAIDSVLMQQTDFDFELLINDDNSIDGTTEVLFEYQKKYPDIIRVVTHKENQHNKGVQDAYVRFLFPMAKGEYIAMNDGDDYFTDEHKLQKLSDFLDGKPKTSVVFNKTRIIFPDDPEMSPEFMPTSETVMRGLDLVGLVQKNYMRVNSIMYRKSAIERINKYVNFKGCYAVDWSMNLYAARAGEIGYIDEVMGEYRRHKDCVSYNAHKSIERLLVEKWLPIQRRYFEEYKFLSGEAKRITAEKIRDHNAALNPLPVPRNTKRWWKLLLLLRYKGLVREVLH